MSYKTLDQTNESSIRGLSIAALVFTVLCLLSLFAFMSALPQAKDYMKENRSAIVGAFEQSQSYTDTQFAQSLFDVNMNGDNIDTKAAADALANSGNEKAAEFAKFLHMTTNGSISEIYDFLSAHNYSEFLEMKHAVENLTDAEIQQIASTNASVSASQITALRDTASSVTDESLSFMSRYMGPEGSDNLLDDSISVVMAAIYFVTITLIVLNLIVLAACVLGIVFAKRAKKNNVAFVFVIISAVICLVEFALVRCVLLIIDAVRLGQARRIARTGGGNGGNGGTGVNSNLVSGKDGTAAQSPSGEPYIFSN